MSYKRFFAMIATSTVAMFILMYSTVYALDHVFWSSTKTYMALYMGATMAVIMLAFMLKMYDNKKVNIAIFVGSALLFAVVFWVFRSQVNVGDVTYMRQMIPHHSLAILTSERANITDPRVRRLADDIIRAQRLEIAEMEALIADLEGLDLGDQPVLKPTVPPIEGGSETLPDAPSLFVADAPATDGIVRIAEAKVASDAWVVIHATTADGSPDPEAIVGRAFLLHGETKNVPVKIDATVTPGTTLYAMLHEDTGQIGVFEFSGSGSLDQPLMHNGSPVVQSFVAQ